MWPARWLDHPANPALALRVALPVAATMDKRDASCHGAARFSFLDIDPRMFEPRVRAILGPTNTGKTHLAIERMLAHASGSIGF
ncbi:MAG: hypothetical protein ACK5X3_13320, partial [Pseudomonadota bacterium]